VHPRGPEPPLDAGGHRERIGGGGGGRGSPPPPRRLRAGGGAPPPPPPALFGGGRKPSHVAGGGGRRGARRGGVVAGGVAGAAAEGYRHLGAGLGRLGHLGRLARRGGCRDVVFSGAVTRPAITQLRFDLTTLMVLPRIIKAFAGGDDHLLTRVSRIIEG